MSQGFDLPNFDAPLDLDARLAQIPKNHTIKGVICQAVESDVRAKTGSPLGRGSYMLLKSYPLGEYLTVAARGAALLYPEAKPREGVRLLAHKAFSALLEGSSLAKVLFSAVGRDPANALRILDRAYSIATNSGTLSSEVTDRRALVSLRGSWIFDATVVGGIEGVLKYYDARSELRIRQLSPCDFDVLVTWG
jgi:uncharacterized protein (TIGR02265 family)